MSLVSDLRRQGARSVLPARSRRADPLERSPLELLRSRRRDRVLMQVILVALALWWLFPLYVAVRKSVEFGGFANYQLLFTQPISGIWLPRTFVNSAVIAAIHALVVVVCSALAGFAFSRLTWRGRDLAYTGTLMFLAVPATALLVPIYYITGRLGMFDSYAAVAFPEATLTLPFGVLLIKNFSDGLPGSMFEAAVLDRANAFQTFWHVFLPQIRTPLTNLAILSVMWSFQDYLFPSLVLRSPEKVTSAQAVSLIQGAFGATPQQQSQFFAALVLLALPAVVLVTVGLRWITKGVTAGATKG